MLLITKKLLCGLFLCAVLSFSNCEFKMKNKVFFKHDSISDAIAFLKFHESRSKIKLKHERLCCSDLKASKLFINF